MADGITTSLLADVTAKYMMADVIAIVADGMATWLECVKADLIALVADGTSHWVSLF